MERFTEVQNWYFELISLIEKCLIPLCNILGWVLNWKYIKIDIWNK